MDLPQNTCFLAEFTRRHQQFIMGRSQCFTMLVLFALCKTSLNLQIFQGSSVRLNFNAKGVHQGSCQGQNVNTADRGCVFSPECK